MNRNQRGAHARLWPLLLLILVAVTTAALVVKTQGDRAVRATAVAPAQER
jgi:hypothetical protein